MNDCIRRQAAIDVMCELMHHWFGGDPKDEIREIRRELEKLPSAQPERKKGRWISRDGEEDCYECSECHAVIEGNEVYWRNNYFCYHCGADMRGEEDE